MGKKDLEVKIMKKDVAVVELKAKRNEKNSYTMYWIWSCKFQMVARVKKDRRQNVCMCENGEGVRKERRTNGHTQREKHRQRIRKCVLCETMRLTNLLEVFFVFFLF